jgi:hypothetical protein
MQLNYNLNLPANIQKGMRGIIFSLVTLLVDGSNLNGDVEEVVGDHFGGLRRPPAFTATILLIGPGFGSTVWSPRDKLSFFVIYAPEKQKLVFIPPKHF